MRGTGLMRSKRFAIACMAAIVAVTVAVGVMAYQRTQNPFPTRIREATSLPLYYPTELPYDYKVNPESFALNGKLVMYHFENSRDDTINVNIQKLPDDFDVTQQLEKHFTNMKSVATPFGTAHIGTFNGKTIGNIVDGKTWIMAVYNEPGFQDDLAIVMRSLKRHQ